MTRRPKALELGWVAGNAGASPAGRPATIHLGATKDGGRVELDLSDLGQHVFIPGAAGSGKTTTLMSLADGALAHGWGVAIIDCKGTGLRSPTAEAATRRGVPLAIVDPRDPTGLGYNPCTGDPTAVTNKLVGAFTFSPEAEIYQMVVMEVLPLIVRAMHASNSDVTLDAIHRALGKGGLSKLGRQPGAEEYYERLCEFDAGLPSSKHQVDPLTKAGLTGMRHRIGALREGTFGHLFRRSPALDWFTQTQSAALTYLSLSATGAPPDTELFGRVVAQDLKQLVDQRLRAIEAGAALAPLMVMFDEFAALRDPEQVVDLLLQARQALMSIVIATQFIPEPIPIRQPALSAGVLIAHRLEAVDAEVIATEIGTRSKPFVTAQIDFNTGASDVGSVRRVREFIVHPDTIKALPVGTAVILNRGSNTSTITRIRQASRDDRR